MSIEWEEIGGSLVGKSGNDEYAILNTGGLWKLKTYGGVKTEAYFFRIEDAKKRADEMADWQGNLTENDK